MGVSLTPVIEPKQIDGIFADFDTSIAPGGAIGIAVGGTPIYRQGFGLANVELPLTLTPSMGMRIGSVSKQFTALAFLLLCEDELCHPDDLITNFVPELAKTAPGVTARHLMANVSGLRDAVDLIAQCGHPEPSTVSQEELLSLTALSADRNAEPDTTFIYNNGGWVILGIMIERIAGQPLEKVMWERIFARIGMYDTSLRRSEKTLLPRQSTGHRIDSDGGFIRTEPHGGVDLAGAGSIVSTIDDMLRWLAHMSAPRIGSADTWRLMRTPHRLKNGMETRYGLGLYTRLDFRGLETVRHGGGSFGGNAEMIKFLEHDVDIIAISNRRDAWIFDYVGRLVEAIFPDAKESKPASAPIARGLFEGAISGQVVKLFERGGAQWASFNSHEMPLGYESGGVLRTYGAFRAWDYALQPTTGGSEAAYILDSFGNQEELFPMTAVEGPFEMKTGRYVNKAYGIEAQLLIEAGEFVMQLQGGFGSRTTHDLTPISENVWRTAARDKMILPPWGLVRLNGEDLVFSTLLNRDLRFKPVTGEEH